MRTLDRSRFEKVEARHLWLLAFSIFLAAIVADIVHFAEWFQRSGAVVVALVILFFGYDLRKNENYLQTLRWEMEECIYEAEEPLRDAKASALIERARTGDKSAGASLTDQKFLETRSAVKSCRDEFAEMRDQIIAIRRSEIQLGAVGTMVWGFGDVPFSVFQCGWMLCQ